MNEHDLAAAVSLVHPSAPASASRPLLAPNSITQTLRQVEQTHHVLPPQVRQTPCSGKTEVYSQFERWANACCQLAASSLHPDQRLPRLHLSLLRLHVLPQPPVRLLLDSTAHPLSHVLQLVRSLFLRFQQ